jgi:hypothetical protein
MMIILYLDPGSGSFLLQLLIAGFAGLAIAVGASWSKIKRLFTKTKKKADAEDDDDEQQPDA